jgi:starch-binding outer membrane protein, SusD/RagB family
MKKTIYSLIALMMALFVLSSCEDDFLDVIPNYALTDATAISDYSKARAAVDGIYASFRNDVWAGHHGTTMATLAGFVTIAGTEVYDMSYTQLTSPYAANQFWPVYYRSLNHANFAIKGISDLPLSAFNNEGEKDALLAEARILRAFINMHIFWNFGYWWADDANLYGLLYKDQPSDLSNVTKARVSVGESYEGIFSDIDFAITNLGNYTTPRYMSKQFAQALKAKILLYRAALNNNVSELQTALGLVNDVLGSLPASVRIEADMADVYKKAWDNTENLFVRYLENDGTRFSSGGYWYTYGLSQIVGDRLPLAPGAEYTAGLVYGAQWFRADPRWSISTGVSRASETWDTSERWTWVKLGRSGRYAGQQASPQDDLFATYFLRIPELLIMKAELLARTGATIAQSVAPINQLRASRTNPVLPALNPGSQTELMDLIFKEYLFELFMENGSEYFASIRFQNAGQPYIVSIKDGRPFDITKSIFPIPDAEMINNILMVQNPGMED